MRPSAEHQQGRGKRKPGEDRSETPAEGRVADREDDWHRSLLSFGGRANREERESRETRGSLRALLGAYTPLVARVPPNASTDYTDVAQVFIDSRYALFIAQRCGTRINQLISPLWDDRGFVRHSIPAALLGVDLAVFRWIKRDERLNLAPRLALDAAEIFLTALVAVRDDYDESTIPLLPGVRSPSRRPPETESAVWSFLW